jgi:hypothetical protein
MDGQSDLLGGSLDLDLGYTGARQSTHNILAQHQVFGQLAGKILLIKPI